MENIDERLAEVQQEICGRDGAAAEWNRIINQSHEDARATKKAGEQLKKEAEIQGSEVSSLTTETLKSGNRYLNRKIRKPKNKKNQTLKIS